MELAELSNMRLSLGREQIGAHSSYQEFAVSGNDVLRVICSPSLTYFIITGEEHIFESTTARP